MRHRSGDSRIDRLGWPVLLVALVGVWLGTGLGIPTPAGGSQTGITGWTMIGNYDENTLGAGEGVATVTRSPHDDGSYELYRGIQSVPSALNAQGWGHIGDPDSIHGYVIDAYQGPSSGNSKMFLVTTPSGATYQYVHQLVSGELYNNSFVAISPNSQWMVGGEWGTMSHLQIYPTPLLNHATPQTGGALPLAGYIQLDHQVNDIQGCDFVTHKRLICASDDDSMTLFPEEKPLLEIDLPGPLHGSTVNAHVVNLGAIPQQSSCTGTFESEGVDFDKSTGVLRVEVIAPGSCILTTAVYEYTSVRRPHP
jgi:hypothetical protein